MHDVNPRAITPLDLPLVRRVIPQRLPLDMPVALTRGLPGLEEMLLAAVPLADLGAPTMILRDRDRGYVGQFRQYAQKTVAHLAFLAPEPQENDVQHWTQLLEAMAFDAGRRGAHRINAEITEDHPVFQALRQAGFVVYSRQVILRREPGAAAGNLALLRPAVDQDSIAVNLLYTNIVPRLLQQAEPLSMSLASDLIHEHLGQVMGYLAITSGKNGIVIKPYFHPEAYEQVPAIISSALRHMPSTTQRPVYIYARAYQDWLRGVLAQVGFTPWSHQVLMGKCMLIRSGRMETITRRTLETNLLRPPVTEGPLSLRKISDR